ncbi:MAG: hypothetical protein IKE24_12965 [Clostridia bacterium]|nr:hypothetical protein [Clostridia bacterium]
MMKSTSNSTMISNQEATINEGDHTGMTIKTVNDMKFSLGTWGHVFAVSDRLFERQELRKEIDRMMNESEREDAFIFQREQLEDAFTRTEIEELLKTQGINGFVFRYIEQIANGRSIPDGATLELDGNIITVIHNSMITHRIMIVERSLLFIRGGLVFDTSNAGNLTDVVYCFTLDDKPIAATIISMDHHKEVLHDRDSVIFRRITAEDIILSEEFQQAVDELRGMNIAISEAAHVAYEAMGHYEALENRGKPLDYWDGFKAMTAEVE